MEFDPEILKRVWGNVLPTASDHYDNAIERMSRAATPYNRVQADHVLEFVESAWRDAVDGSGCTVDMLRHMQQTLLATADAVKLAMERYVASDQAAADRLAVSHAIAQDTTGMPHPVVELPL